ncbi:MAG: hypothetical protein OXU61_01465, partial [Gammaproteobacteria bacterium]|nr:hypothetical protein [Gammaproteobacteria bacterium]
MRASIALAALSTSVRLPVNSPTVNALGLRSTAVADEGSIASLFSGKLELAGPAHSTRSAVPSSATPCVRYRPVSASSVTLAEAVPPASLYTPMAVTPLTRQSVACVTPFCLGAPSESPTSAPNSTRSTPADTTSA